MAGYYNRYSQFTSNNTVEIIPFIEIPKTGNDIFIKYVEGFTRFDKLSLKYYGVPYYGWLINLANPQYGQLEFDIPDGSIIRIPLPLNDALSTYESGVQRYKNL